MSDEEDVSYLDIPTKEVEKVWCKIGEAGNLEFVDWNMVHDIAQKFDTNKPENRTEQMLIAKLMWLVREDARKEFGHDN